MKLLKDERVVALNDCITLCLDAARLYTALAAAGEGRPLARELQALAERRLSLAARLATAVRALDELPAAPPQEERALLETAAARLKANLAEESDRKVRDEVAQKEAQLRQAAEKLLSLDLAEETLAAARELAGDPGFHPSGVHR
jgi:hypothetical protein